MSSKSLLEKFEYKGEEVEVDEAKDVVNAVKIEEEKKIIPEPEIKKVIKTAEKKSTEKKSATI